MKMIKEIAQLSEGLNPNQATVVGDVSKRMDSKSGLDQLNETTWSNDDIEDLFSALRKLADKHKVPNVSSFMADVKKAINKIGID